MRQLLQVAGFALGHNQGKINMNKKTTSQGLSGLTEKEQARAASKAAASIPMLTGYANTLEKGGKPGYKNLGLEIYQAGYTHATLVHLGLVEYKVGADHVSKGAQGRDSATLRAFLGNTAPGYWVKQGWLKADAKGLLRVTVSGLNILNERLQGRSKRQAFNTNPDAVKALLSWVAKGRGIKAVPFNPAKVSIKA